MCRATEETKQCETFVHPKFSFFLFLRLCGMIDTLYGHVKNAECVFLQSYASPTDLRSMTHSRHRYTRMDHLIIVELLCALMPNHSNDLAMVCVVDDDAGCSRKYFRSLSFAFVCR